MKAILMTAAGAPDVLHIADVPEPEITKPMQIKVNIKAAGINPVDTKLRSRGVLYPDALPAILGCDGAGIVTETGPIRSRVSSRAMPSGSVTADSVVHPVITRNIPCCMNPGQRLMPAALDFVEAAALPLVLITAWEALFDRAGPGRRSISVLVHAGAGGVGHVAIQLARSVGAQVATTVSTAEKAATIRQAARCRQDHYL